jgi:hypothetical protein
MELSLVVSRLTLLSGALTDLSKTARATKDERLQTFWLRLACHLHPWKF